jgi:hypothetical protein
MCSGSARQAEAQAYLERELGARAPGVLTPVAEFDEQPLEGEGAASLFTFDLPPAPAACGEDADARHYVVVGATAPNYFPAYGLSPDEAYSLHIGTRFMLGLEIALADASAEPPAARENARRFVSLCNPDVPIEEIELAALFRCAEELYAVYAVSLGGRRVYCFGADCPPGFSELTQHPPQVALRLHLGRLIRREARDESRSGVRGERGT